MKRVNLNECSIEELRGLLNITEDIFFIAENKFDVNLLDIINQHCKENITLSLRPDNDRGISLDLLKRIPNIQRLNISPNAGSPLSTLLQLEEIKKLTSLSLGAYVKENISFAPMMHIKTLEQFAFDDKGLDKKQYDFINQQTQLEKLHIRAIDLSLINNTPSLKDLRVHRSLKNEDLLSERFPNLRKFHLHGDSRRENHAFIQNLSNIEDVTINYNGHLTSFPKIKNPEKIKRICLLECYNFEDINSLLPFENMETLCLTTYNKSLKISGEDFSKLRQLKKLKHVYMVWGKGKEPANVEKIYKETGWINSMG